jgi:DNA-binding MurR/RpiR family transcriptional regulator
VTGASFQRLQEAILACRDSLTPTERLISSHLLEHPRSVALMSIQELAGHLKTGPASIIRLAQKLGYRGYSELKGDLKQALREDGSPLERFKMALDGPELLDASGIQAIARQEMDNLRTTAGLLDPAALAATVALVGRAKLVYTAGIGISSHLANLAAFVLQHIGVRAFPVAQTGLGMAEQLVTIGRDDVLLTFAFPPHSGQTIEAAALAKAQGAAVIGITDQSLSPLADHCDLVLVAKTDSSSPSNSLSAPLMLVHWLAIAVANAQRQRSSRAIARTISLRNRQP